ncbi:DUF1707 SHOCT-like domain-containing protein [Naumannella cuiyingiana]|uniref:DUF1707 domain-containing protein n=1 Tax=Naumannella cuiyingiana TaxID=1347891 RepID=A0A7Z0IKA9_9ACTN|nr:DUF1707 domain-containing protein [Naumannella cuiyingiana]NYI70400.1 hypothetical protein [Naumannella cuiyingiana]
MSGDLPISSKYRSTPTAPVDDAERERLTRQLNDAYTRGQLDADDYQQRLDRLYAAGSLGELVPVVEGLPPLPTHAEPAIVAQSGQPGEVGGPPRGAGFSRVALGVIVGSVALLVLLILLLIIF